MKLSRLIVLISAFSVSLLVDSGMSPAWAGPGPDLREIEKLLLGERRGKSSQTGKRLSFLKDGHVHIKLHTGFLQFEFKHVDFLAGRTPHQVSFVKGTVICQFSAGAGATLVDTPAMAVTGHGPVTFSGHVSLPRECVSAPQDIAFAIRTVQEDQREGEFAH